MLEVIFLKWTREIVKKVAEKKGWKLNPNEEELEGTLMGLNKNKEKYGFFYCPCRVVEGDREKDKDKICPCIWSEEEVERDGHCLCRLYFKNE
ncbi:MAG: ferredoxin:thioredoxin reductase [Promethearchaeota archaeon]|nr:MAG: ferredoxin:thioredoxin reductase [Candidatus Lokiarchaeota archaeon]